MLTVVTGPPCSGKTTYVREHAEPGDIVIDFDILAEAIGSPDSHSHPDPIRYVTAVMRRSAVTAAVRQHMTRDARVWIVETSLRSRAHLYEIAKATIVTLGGDPAELHRRAHAERPRRWHKLIDEWQPHATQQAEAAPPLDAGAAGPPRW